jgi:hypothetical protein
VTAYSGLEHRNGFDRPINQKILRASSSPLIGKSEETFGTDRFFHLEGDQRHPFRVVLAHLGDLWDFGCGAGLQ